MSYNTLLAKKLTSLLALWGTPQILGIIEVALPMLISIVIVHTPSQTLPNVKI